MNHFHPESLLIHQAHFFRLLVFLPRFFLSCRARWLNGVGRVFSWGLSRPNSFKHHLSCNAVINIELRCFVTIADGPLWWTCFFSIKEIWLMGLGLGLRLEFGLRQLTKTTKREFRWMGWNYGSVSPPFADLHTKIVTGIELPLSISLFTPIHLHLSLTPKAIHSIKTI